MNAARSTTRAERLLANVIRLGASVLFLAAAAVVLPFPMMDFTHQLLRLGALPDIPIVQYLTRSLSALYVFHGAIMYLSASDVRCYGPLIRLMAWGDIVFGATLFAIDAAVGMPWYWAAAEGPSLVGYAILILWLLARSQRAVDAAH